MIDPSKRENIKSSFPFNTTMSFLRTALPARAIFSRAYATSAKTESSSNLASILLGAGLVGSAGFWYSTRGSAKENAELKAKASDASNVVVPPTVAALVAEEFRSLKLESIIPYNHNTSTFTFTLPPGTNSGMITASALVVKSATEGLALAKNGKPAVRPYTPTTSPTVEGKIVRSPLPSICGCKSQTNCYRMLRIYSSRTIPTVLCHHIFIVSK
jgi:hypothetical protein